MDINNLNNMDLNLNLLQDLTIDMMDKCENIIREAIDSMVKKDIEAANNIVILDDDIDELRDAIREKSIELIALKQPMATDLRTIYGLGAIAMELERVGDYAVNISMETIKIGQEEYVEELIDIPKMKDTCIKMLENTKTALRNNDYKLAYKTGLKDDIIDDLYNDVYIDAVGAMRRDVQNISQGLKLLFVGRYLERIGDHITNVCEMIMYIIKGELIEFD